ncbi:MAG: glycosyltransferase [Gammaproteobacteria bacterium]
MSCWRHWRRVVRWCHAERGFGGFRRPRRSGLVAEREPAALACAIGQLLEDAQLRERMRHAGRRAVREHYGWATVARRMEGLYAELLAASRPAPAGR